ncbi:MAG: biotin--[acetyl-CoA-carboxylase] ligase [Chloroflexota bacterium]
MSFMKPIQRELLRDSFATEEIGHTIQYHLETDSTNNQAKLLAKKGAPHGTVLLAEMQTKGRGRLGRSWLAPPFSSVLLSVLFRPQLDPIRLNRLTMLCGVSAATAVRELLGLRVMLKWPNDFLVQSTAGEQGWSKIGGMLTESSFTGSKLDYVIVGIGINVNLDPADLGYTMMPASSLSAEIGEFVNRTELVTQILSEINQGYSQLAASENEEQEWDCVFQQWRRMLHTLGQKVTVSYPGGRIQGTAVDADLNGNLIVRDLAGNLLHIAVGDVSLRQDTDLASPMTEE